MFLLRFFQNTTRSWILLVIAVACSAIVIQQYPNLYAYQNTPDGMSFSGQATWFDPWDINVYVAVIRSGQTGSILIGNQYTSSHNNSSFIYPVYTIIGFIFRDANPFLLFHLMAICGEIVLAFGIYHFAFLLTRDHKKSLLVLPLTLFGGGIGWMVHTLHRSADISVTSFTFLSSLQRSHEAFGTILFIGSLVGLYCLYNSKQSKWAVFCSLSLLGSVVFYPYYLLSYFLIAVIYGVYMQQSKKNSREFVMSLLALVLPSCVAIIYYIHLQMTGFASATEESLPNVGLVSLFFGYAIFFVLLPLAVVTEKKYAYNRNLVIYLIIWIAISVVLAYSPFGFSRFYLRGLFFPLITLTVTLIWALEKHLRMLLILTFFPLFFFTQGYIFARRIAEVSSQKDNKWFYFSSEVREGFSLLKSLPNDGVLTRYTLGNYIPAVTGKSVYFGHLIQTPESGTKRKLLLQFYTGGMEDSEACQFLYDNTIHYVVYGHEEMVGGIFVYSCMEATYSSEDFQLFSVVKNKIES